MSRPAVSRVHPHPCRACSVQGSFCSLSDELRSVFESLKTSAAYSKGEVAFHEADPCHSVFVVCKGSIKLVTSSSEGRSLLLRFVGPGGLLGDSEAMTSLASYQCSAIAAEPSVLAVIPRATFVRFVAAYPEAALRLTHALSEEYKMAQRETKALAFGGTSTSRLAHLLLEQASKHGEVVADGIHIPSQVTHLEFAQWIGSTRETVTRVLGNLEHDGVIERTACEIVIHDPAALASLTAVEPHGHV